MLRSATWLLPLFLSVASVYSAPDNLVANAGFEAVEEGRPAGWRGDATVYSRDDTVAHSGKASLKFTNADPERYVLCVQSVPLEPGRRYEMSAWVKVEDLVGEDTGATLCLEWQDDDGRWLGGHYVAGVKGTADWQQIHSISGRVPLEARSAHVACYVRKGMTGTAWWEDVVVTRYKEDPLSVVLLEPSYRGLLPDDQPLEVHLRAMLNLVDYERTLDTLELHWKLHTRDGNPPTVVSSGNCRKLTRADVDLDLSLDGVPHGRYALEVSLKEAAGGATLSSKTLRLERVATLTDRTAYLDEHQRLIVDGQPFFPLGMYWSGINEADLKIYADSAFNCLMPYGRVTPEQMDLVHKYGLKLIYSVKDCYAGSKWCPKDIQTPEDELPVIKRQVETFRDHPALLAWYLNDELPTTYLPRLEAHQQWLEELDPNHPTWVVLYQVGLVRDYLQTFDVLGTDPYPIPRKPASLAADWTRRTREGVLGSRPLWQVPQAFNWANYHKDQPDNRPPTLPELRSMVWQCIAEGASGIVLYSFFNVRRDPDFPFEQRWPEIKTVAREVSDFLPALLAVDPPPPLEVKPHPWLHTALRRAGEEVWLFLVNDGPSPGATSVRAPDGWDQPTVALGVAGVVAQPGRVWRVPLQPFEVKVLRFTRPQ